MINIAVDGFTVGLLDVVRVFSAIGNIINLYTSNILLSVHLCALVNAFSKVCYTKIGHLLVHQSGNAFC